MIDVTATTVAPYEPTAIMRAHIRRATRRATHQVRKHAPTATKPVIVTALHGPVPTPGTPADRECDRCRTVVPLNDFLLVGRVEVTHHHTTVVIALALCAPCTTIERPHIDTNRTGSHVDMAVLAMNVEPPRSTR